MKESFMIFVIMAVILTPFLPSLLKGKCPNCGKRKLDTFEPELAEAPPPGTYMAYFSCQNCEMRFERNKSGPLVPLQSDAIPHVQVQ